MDEVETLPFSFRIAIRVFAPANYQTTRKNMKEIGSRSLSENGKFMRHYKKYRYTSGNHASFMQCC